MTSQAFDDRAHGFTPDAVNQPVSWALRMADTESYTNAGLPYTRGGRFGEVARTASCTTCHNVHRNDSAPYLWAFKSGEISYEGPFTSDASLLCKGCHVGRENPGRLGAANVFSLKAVAYSTHPTDVVVSDLPGNGVTRFGAVDPRLTVTVASFDNWTLGAHLTDPRKSDATRVPFSCQTCHVVHGSAAAPGVHHPGLLAITDGGDPSTLCLGCHAVPVGGSGTGAARDHPMTSMPGAPPSPPKVAGEIRIPAAWEAARHFDSGAQALDPARGGLPACLSCHDVHGGLPGTSLLRGPNTADGGAGNWCFNCHAAGSVTPRPAHPQEAAPYSP